MGKLYVLSGGQTEIHGVPEVIPILPLGYVKSQKGNFQVDKESFLTMKKHMDSRGIDIVIDYEHQTLEHVQAPAGGWIKDIILQDGAIAAKVEWTEAAKKYLANKEYRYLSPVILVRKSDKKAVVLHSVALTNTPAIDGMFPIINSVNVENYENEGGNTMDLKLLAKMLGLPEDATEEQITAKMKEMIDKAEQSESDAEKKKEAVEGGDGEVVANKAVLHLLELKEDARTEDIVTAILSLKQSSGKNLEQEVRALKEKIAKQEAMELVMTAMKAGKIVPAQKETMLDFAFKYPNEFDKFMEKAPQVVPLGEIELEVKAHSNKGFDEETVVVCKMLGVSKEDLEKFGKE